MPGKKSQKKDKNGKSDACKKRKRSAKTEAADAPEPDILDPPAMKNLYYIAHGAADALTLRGFHWAGKTKKKGGKKKKK